MDHPMIQRLATFTRNKYENSLVYITFPEHAARRSSRRARITPALIRNSRSGPLTTFIFDTSPKAAQCIFAPVVAVWSIRLMLSVLWCA